MSRIVIPRWDDFQHYKDRDAVAWIKNYTRLLSDDNYLALTLHQRGVLHGLWLEYARARRQLTDSTASISRRLGGRVTKQTLDSLNHAGFIDFSSRGSLEQLYTNSSSDKRRQREELPPQWLLQDPVVDISETRRQRIEREGLESLGELPSVQEGEA